MSATSTLPSPYPYHEVIVNNTCAYLLVHSDKGRQVYRVDDKGFKQTNKNPIGTPEHNWQDCVSLKIIQTIYFSILDEYREDAKIVDISKLRAIKNGEIPF